MASSAGLRPYRDSTGVLTIEWRMAGRVSFASLWLRDNVREDRDPHNRPAPR